MPISMGSHILRLKDSDSDIENTERLNMLYLLSKFMYFGNRELRQLIVSLYRDLFKYPIVSAIRKDRNDTVDLDVINAAFEKELSKTKKVYLLNKPR